MIRVGWVLVAVVALAGCGTTAAEPEAAPVVPAVQQAEPCELVSQELLDRHGLEKSSDNRGVNGRNCVWNSDSNFSLMVLIGWDRAAQTDFHQLFPDPAGEVVIAQVKVVVSKSRLNPSCGTMFVAEQGTVVEVAAGYAAPAPVNAACAQAKAAMAVAIEKLRQQQML
ncbi:DUF3558 family protein [Kribbella antibiotica]|nr:DUF3558 family protein [Kribbella antibiotica]